MSNEVTCDRTRLVDPIDTYHDFGIKDEKGRAVGVRERHYVVLYVANGKTSGYCHTPGIFYVVDVQATRNGEVFGASNRDGYHDTAALAQADAAQRIATTRKRYLKKYGQPA